MPELSWVDSVFSAQTVVLRTGSPQRTASPSRVAGTNLRTSIFLDVHDDLQNLGHCQFQSGNDKADDAIDKDEND